jgi:hypothetical protein
MKNLAFILILLVAASGSGAGPDSHDLVKHIVDRALENDKASEEYGFHQQTVVKEFDSKGQLKKQETRTYQTAWIETKPYAELLKINDKPPGEKEKKEEAKRRQKFTESIHSKKKQDKDDDFNLTWENLSRKYEFTEIPSDGTAALVLHFEPKTGDLQERSKMEKVFNNVNGTVWADDQYDLVKAQTSLVRSVKFGLGLVAKLDKLDITYSQTRFENVCLPQHFRMKFNARIALFKTENQEVDISFSDYFHRPAS